MQNRVLLDNYIEINSSNPTAVIGACIANDDYSDWQNWCVSGLDFTFLRRRLKNKTKRLNAAEPRRDSFFALAKTFDNSRTGFFFMEHFTDLHLIFTKLK